MICEVLVKPLNDNFFHGHITINEPGVWIVGPLVTLDGKCRARSTLELECAVGHGRHAVGPHGMGDDGITGDDSIPRVAWRW